MNPDQGGLSSPEDKQRQAAAAIARQKVLNAYKSDGSNYAAATPTAAPNTLSQEAKIKSEDWQKYHSAWQEYYQKYYSSYYTKAAHQYFEQEKLKIERQAAEEKAKSASLLDANTQTADPNVSQQEKIKENIKQKARGIRKSRHFIPIVIALSIVILGILLQYNQVIFANVAAYISPGGGNVNEIESLDPTITAEVGPEPLLIIPKLNVRVPINFGYASDQASMSSAMLNGVAHFSIPGANAYPGQIGNFVISGHSAGNVYWNSDYKFIFSGLDRLVDGDLIYVNYNSIRYTYKLNSKRTVLPSEVSALTDITKENSGKPAITMITCTPLGTSKYRLLVSAVQVSPNPGDAASAEPSQPDQSEDNEVEMPANEAPPLEAFWNWLTGQN